MISSNDRMARSISSDFFQETARQALDRVWRSSSVAVRLLCADPRRSLAFCSILPCSLKLWAMEPMSLRVLDDRFDSFVVLVSISREDASKLLVALLRRVGEAAGRAGDVLVERGQIHHRAVDDLRQAGAGLVQLGGHLLDAVGEGGLLAAQAARRLGGRRLDGLAKLRGRTAQLIVHVLDAAGQLVARLLQWRSAYGSCGRRGRRQELRPPG